jgi:hypothetical protein
MRAVCLPLLAMIGCGRIGFGASGAGGDGAPGGDAVADAPPVPAAICAVDRVALPSIPANADLALVATTAGWTAVWTDAASPGPVFGARFDRQRRLIATGAIPGITTDVVGGLADTGNVIELATTSGADTTVWTLPHDLSSATARTTLPAAITGRDPFPADQTLTNRGFLSAQGNTLVMMYVNADGTLSAAGNYTTPNTITSLAAADGPDHAHLVWTEDIGGGMSQCSASDIDFVTPSWPQMGSMVVLSSDCYELRNETGPRPPDGMVIVWTTAAHTVEARYIVSTGGVSTQLSTHGRAPRTTYDGAKTWVAWIDQRGGADEVHVASFDLVTGALVETALPGWLPAGDEALELVRDGADIFVAILSRDAISMLRTCP